MAFLLATVMPLVSSFAAGVVVCGFLEFVWLRYLGRGRLMARVLPGGGLDLYISRQTWPRGKRLSLSADEARELHELLTRHYHDSDTVVREGRGRRPVPDTARVEQLSDDHDERAYLGRWGRWW